MENKEQPVRIQTSLLSGVGRKALQFEIYNTEGCKNQHK